MALSSALAIIGMCSPMWVPGILVGMPLKSPRMLAGRIGLGIPDVDVAGPALQEDHDHGFGDAEAARAFELVGGLRRLLPGEEVREVQSEHPDGSGAQQFAARGAFAGVTLAAWNYQHDDFSSRSVVVQKSFAVDQRPQQILRARGASAAGLQILHAALQFGGDGRPAERRQVQFARPRPRPACR